MHEGIIDKLYNEYTARGFLSEDRIFAVIEENGVSLFDVEYICDHLLSKGVIIRDGTLPDEDAEEYDRSNSNYEEVYREILEIDDSLSGLIEYIRKIQAPQHREWQILMPQVSNNAFARNQIFEMYMKVAVRIALVYAKRYQLPLDDTIQNALMGLYISIDKYKTSRQENFSQYFPFWVRQYIMREAQTPNPSVYFPAHMKEKLFEVYDIIENHFECLDDRGNPSEEFLQSIADELACNVDEARQLVGYLKPFESIEALLENEENEILFSDGGITCKKMDALLEREFIAEVLSDTIKSLSAREQDVILMRYGVGLDHEYTLEEIGQKFKLTRERVRQIERKAFRKILFAYRGRAYRAGKKKPTRKT